MGLDLGGVDLMTETIRTSRLVLRPWRAADAEDVARACQDADIQRWVTAVPSPYTLGDARQFVTELAFEQRRAGTGVTAAIQELGTGRPVGSVGVIARTPTIGPEIGYWVAPWGRGHGFAAEATDALSRWAFEHGARRVSLLAAPSNAASCRTAERAGFQREGLLREAEVDRSGQARDLVLFARLASDPGVGTTG